MAADAGKIIGVIRGVLKALTDSKAFGGPFGRVLDWGRKAGLWSRGQGPGDFKR